MKVIIICQDKNLIFLAFLIVLPCLKGFYIKKKPIIMSFVLSFGQKSFFFKNKLQIGIET